MSISVLFVSHSLSFISTRALGYIAIPTPMLWLSRPARRYESRISSDGQEMVRPRFWIDKKTLNTSHSFAAFRTNSIAE